MSVEMDQESISVVFVCVRGMWAYMHRRGCKDMNPQGDVRGADTAVPGSDCGFECWRAPSWHLHPVVTPLEEEEKPKRTTISMRAVQEKSTPGK